MSSIPCNASFLMIQPLHNRGGGHELTTVTQKMLILGKNWHYLAIFRRKIGPLPEVWVTVVECGHCYVVAATATSPGSQWLVKGTDTMLAPGAALPWAVGGPTTPSRVLRGVIKPRDKRKVYSVFSTVFLLLLPLVVAVGCPAACFG